MWYFTDYALTNSLSKTSCVQYITYLFESYSPLICFANCILFLCIVGIQGARVVKPTGNGQFGRVADVKSFIDYKASIGRPSKGKLGKGKRKSDEENNTKEVIITIGLMAWDESDDVLKEKERQAPGNTGSTVF